jgi:hypothetical protein
MIWFLLVFVTCNGAEHKKQEPEVYQSPVNNLDALHTLTTVVLNNKFLTNIDFKNLINGATCAESIDVSNNNIAAFEQDIRPLKSLRQLNLSNNSFDGQFSLIPNRCLLSCFTPDSPACLALFPNLEKLQVNNNKITSFAVGSFSNNTLKILEAKNTDCAEINLLEIYKHLRLDILDLSDSKLLSRFTHMPLLEGSITKDTYTLQVNLANTVIPEVDMKNYKKLGNIDIQCVRIMKNTVIILGVFIGVGFVIPCQLITPSYCLHSPIPIAGDTYSPERATKITTNIMINNLLFLGIGASLGYRIGKTIAHRLPNQGKRTAIEFMTNNTSAV